MGESAYSVAASLMRYFFVALLAFIIIGTAICSVIENARMRSLKRTAALDVRFIEMLAPPCYAGRWFCVDDGVTIGSEDGCDIVLSKSELEGMHASVDITKNGVVFSTRKRRFAEINGVKPARRTVLKNGDRIWIRDVCFVCRKNRRDTNTDVGEKAMPCRE